MSKLPKNLQIAFANKLTPGETAFVWGMTLINIVIPGMFIFSDFPSTINPCPAPIAIITGLLAYYFFKEFFLYFGRPNNLDYETVCNRCSLSKPSDCNHWGQPESNCPDIKYDTNW